MKRVEKGFFHCGRIIEDIGWDWVRDRRNDG
jgi:hypothetical protein